MHHSIRSVVLVLILLPLFLVFARQKAADVLPDTPAGKAVAAYIKAFNSGNETMMREFFTKYASAAALQQVPLDRRLDRYGQMKGRLQSLELRTVSEIRNDLVSARFKTGTSGEVMIEFTFDPQPPHGLMSIRVQDVDQGEPATSIERKRNDIELTKAVESYLLEAEKTDSFSGVVLITKNDSSLFHKAYGLADRESKIPNQLDTKFNIGSINKSFTNIAIHQLVKRQKLALSDRIEKFLPDYPNPEAARKVTIQHLLSMTSGIGDFFGERYQSTPKEQLKSIKDFLPLFADKPLEFEPGTKYRYSNGGYVVLGAIIEKASGIDYFTYVRENIYKPAGMLNTDSFEKNAEVPNRALGYTLEPGGNPPVRNDQTLPAKGSSAGGGYSTATDLLRFTQALKAGILESPDFSPAAGMGIAGGAPGLNAALEWDPRSGYGIIVLANLDPPAAQRVARQIRNWLPR